MVRANGQRTFLVYEQKGDKIVATGQKMTSDTPTSAAMKAGNDLARQKKVDVVEFLLRIAGNHEKMRRYKVTVTPFANIEPSGEKFRATRCKKEVLAADSPDLAKANVSFAKKANNPATKAPWTDAELKAINGTRIAGGVKLNAGEHLVLRGKAAKSKYLGLIEVPEYL